MGGSFGPGAKRAPPEPSGTTAAEGFNRNVLEVARVSASHIVGIDATSAPRAKVGERPPVCRPSENFLEPPARDAGNFTLPGEVRCQPQTKRRHRHYSSTRMTRGWAPDASALAGKKRVRIALQSTTVLHASKSRYRSHRFCGSNTAGLPTTSPIDPKRKLGRARRASCPPLRQAVAIRAAAKCLRSFQCRSRAPLAPDSRHS